MRIAFLLLALLSFSFGLDLRSALELARKNNKEIRAQRFAVSSALRSLQADKNLYLPEFFLNYRYSYQTERQSMSIPPNPFFPQGFNLSSSERDYQSLDAGLRYTLYDGGFRSSKIKISELNLGIQEELLKEKEQDILLEVINAYLDAMSTKSLVEVLKEQERVVSFAKRRAEEFYKEGLVAITDVLQAQVRLSEVRRDLRHAEGNYRTALSRLSQLIGAPVDHVEEVQSEVREDTLEAYTESALKNRAVLEVYRKRISQAQELQRLSTSSLLPKLLLQAQYLYLDQNPAVSPKGYGIFSVGFGWSLQGLQDYYKRLEAVEEERKAKAEYEDAVDKVVLAVKSAYEDLKTAEDNLKVAREGLEYAQKFYELVQEQYANQIVGMLELLDAQASLTRAKKNLSLSYYGYLKAYSRLLRETGGLR